MAEPGRPEPDTLWSPTLAEADPRDLCTDCGISRTSDPKRCGRACQFIKPDYDAMERRVHSRARDRERPDEIYFWPPRRMVRAALKSPRNGAQWTGIATTERLHEFLALLADDPATITYLEFRADN